VGLLVDRWKRSGPREVERHPVFGAGAREADPFEGLDDLETERADLGVEAVVAVECVGGPHRVLVAADAHGGVGIDDAKVRIHPESGHQEGVAGATVGVEVAAVIGVAIGTDHVGHRQRGLVQRVLVEGMRHGSDSGSCGGDDESGRS
jgi:hypothetical protein